MPWPQYSRTTEKRCFFDVFLDGLADVAEELPGGHLLDPQPHALECHLGQSFCLDRGLADEKHPAGIPVKAVLDDRDVDIDGVPRLELPLAGDAVADHVVDRRADGFREAAVVERGRDRVLSAGDVFVADRVQFTGRDARFDMLADHVQDVGRQAAGDPHFVLFFRRFDRNVHSECLGSQAGRDNAAGKAREFPVISALLAQAGYGIKRAPRRQLPAGRLTITHVHRHVAAGCPA